ncbi:hypothetical protein DHEL01_v203766 [Diaporthe helianthi]|uniref:Spherulin-4 n=1 Tax=Diaporthe helianthi TaxID=158607 RepID=A0A2P5I5Q1_DIAHE|nr:hypothetical protein DHEL01_v203766 [Diaporthe helianthi]
MRPLVGLAALAAIAMASTDVMVPLYVYPGNNTWTNPNWEAAVDAIKDNPHMHFYVIINPNNGPQNTSDPSGFNEGYCNVENDDYIQHGCNRDWTTHLADITKLSNAQTIGYVYTGYGQRPADEVKADILEWSRWDTAPTWDANKDVDISIHGLWFDEIGSSSVNASLYQDLVTFANETFDAKGSDKGKYTVVLNAGHVVDPDYETQLFNMASAVVTKETCYTTDPEADGVSWDCPMPYTPFEAAKLATGNGLPHNSAFLPQSVVIVHQFRGPTNASVQMLTAQIDAVVDLGFHSTYFTSGSWHTTTSEPATIGNVAKILSEANVAPTSAYPSTGALRTTWACAFLVYSLFNI